MSGARGLEPATFGVTGRTNAMESMKVATFSAAEAARKGRKVATPKASRRPCLRATPLTWGALPKPAIRSLAARSSAHVDLRHTVGIACEAHFLVCQFRQPGQARASLHKKIFR